MDTSWTLETGSRQNGIWIKGDITMLNFDVYAIRTTHTEYSSDIDELFPSFEEAMEHRMEYANWYRPRGEVWIEKYPANSKSFWPTEKWYINADGTVGHYYNYEKR